jgi:hypothetical protein
VLYPVYWILYTAVYCVLGTASKTVPRGVCLKEAASTRFPGGCFEEAALRDAGQEATSQVVPFAHGLIIGKIINYWFSFGHTHDPKPYEFL